MQALHLFLNEMATKSEASVRWHRGSDPPAWPILGATVLHVLALFGGKPVVDAQRGASPQKVGVVSPSRHASTDGLAYGNASGIKVVQTEDIDPKVVGRHALAVKGVNPADLTEEVPRCLRMELVFRERIFASEQAELVLMDFDHQRILAATDGTVAHRELWKVRLDLKANRAAMAAAEVLLQWAVTIHER